VAKLYGDENFDVHTMAALQTLGHDTLTARDAEQVNSGSADLAVLTFATSNHRAVVTFDRLDFLNLPRQDPHHAGITACTDDSDSQGLAARIHEEIVTEQEALTGKILRIYRPKI